MSKLYALSLFVFRRDIRLQDNTALIEALKQSDQVIPCFIFDRRQTQDNGFKSSNCMEFMANSLYELDATLKQKGSRLYFFDGIAEEVVQELIASLPIQSVFHNRDYTPFSRSRDTRIQQICEKNKIAYHCFADTLLHEPEEVLKSNGKPYTVFTPAFRKAVLLPIKPPMKNSCRNYYHKRIAIADSSPLSVLRLNQNPDLFVKGGRKEALALLRRLSTLSDYVNVRDYPEKSGTSKLSAHMKFGTISVREFYLAISRNLNVHHALVRQLHWRDFFTHIAYHFPRVFDESFHHKYDSLSWSGDEMHFQSWCKGETGFPIVDAGMRELNATGYMHNRVRMVTASFLTKDLHIDWRRGEKYFATQLVDYDPAVNNGNWQWAASTGCDAQPYFRIFNPWLQQKKFDAECEYIKYWVPELSDVPAKTIHSLYKQEALQVKGYPSPIVSHAIESKKAKLMYKSV